MFRKPHKRPGKKGFKIDTEKTVARRFESPRSFVSVDNHEVLHEGDKTQRRREIFERAHGRCELFLAPGCKGFANWVGHLLEGWAHLDVPPHRNHCDCLDNGATACDPCHRYYHAHPKLAREILTRRAESQKQFSQLYKETAP